MKTIRRCACCGAQAIALMDGEPVCKKCAETVSKMIEIFKEVFAAAAARTGLTAEEVCRQCCENAQRRAEERARKHAWEQMPDEYDPARDPDHPSNGFRGMD